MSTVPEVPDPPLVSGAPYWYWLGGRPALDFVNTLRERWCRRVECLVTPADLGLWLRQCGLLGEPAGVDGPLLTRARLLREAIDACVVARVQRERPAAAATGELNRWLATAVPRLTVPGPGPDPVLGTAVSGNPAEDALSAIALDAARMLGRDERGRVRVCASDTCSARFFDRSPAGRRRWCSMATCGNVAKARRHRRRQRTGK